MVYGGEQAIHIHRFNNDFVGVNVGAIAQRGDDDYRYVCQPWVPDLFRAEVPAVHHRHPQIEYDQVGRRCLIQVVQSLLPLPAGTAW